MMMADAQLFNVGKNPVFWGQFGGIGAEFHIGHKRAQQDQAIARFNILAQRILAHSTLVDTQIQRVSLAHHRLTENRGAHGNLMALGEAHEIIAQAKAMHL